MKRRIYEKISLFIAMRLDGYIADNKGSVNWLDKAMRIMILTPIQNL